MVYWIEHNWVEILIVGGIVLFCMIPIYYSDFLEGRREAKFIRAMDKYLDAGYGYKIANEIVRQEKVVNASSHKVYDEIVRQEKIKGEINGVKTKK